MAENGKTNQTHPDRSPKRPGLRWPNVRIQLTNWQIVLIALIVVGGRLVIDFSQRIVEGQQKVAEERQLEAEIERLHQERRDLEAAKAYYSSPAFVEAWAHDEGKMVREGERLVVPSYTSPAPEPEPETGLGGLAARTNEDNASTWRVWWSMFFDSSPPFSP